MLRTVLPKVNTVSRQVSINHLPSRVNFVPEAITNTAIRYDSTNRFIALRNISYPSGNLIGQCDTVLPVYIDSHWLSRNAHFF